MNYKVIDSKFDKLLLNIKEHFSNEKNITLFQKRNTIKIVNFKDIDYVVKSFKIPHLLNQIVYNFFRDSKAKRSYENSIKLLDLDINTPKPIGFIEFSTSLLFKNSYYVSEFFDYEFEIRAVFKDKEFENREQILKEFTQFTYELHQKGVYHIDYSPGNILVKKRDDSYLFYIIDVNRMQFLEFDIDLRMKSMAKLTSNAADNALLLENYTGISKIEKNSLKEKQDLYLKKQKEYLENKKRLKKIKG